jgi:diguanylate cyclase (GGDEF)-like protein
MDLTPVRILLVEDDPGDACRLREGLRKAAAFPFDLVHVHSLQAALGRLADGDTDVVLLDLGLPDSRGLETLAWVHGQVPVAPILVLACEDCETMAVRAVAAGAQDYLIKGQLDGRLLARCIRCAIERHRLQRAIQALSLTDELTGLYNRRGFAALAEQQLRLAWRTNRGFFLVFVDVDGLKEINDRLGHPAGDQALVETAEVCRATFRHADIVARLGGDEFAVLAIDCHEDGRGILDRLQHNLKDVNARPGRAYPLSFSAGIARFDPHCRDSLDDLIVRADEAMYAQKRRNRRPARRLAVRALHS